MLSKSYTGGNATPSVAYVYDTAASGAVLNGLGRLVTETTTAAATNYTSFDAMGRVAGSSETINGFPSALNFNYGYNLVGSLTSETYPSGRVVSFSYDSANRINGIADSLSGQNTTYFTNVQYAAQGDFSGYQLGNTVAERRSLRPP